DRGALAVALRHLVRRAAEHLLAVRAQIGARRLVVDDEIGHAADRGRGGDDLGRPARDRAPRGVAAIRGTGDADPARARDPARDQMLDAAADVVLLGAAPECLLDRLAERETEAGRAAVVRLEHVEALRD